MEERRLYIVQMRTSWKYGMRRNSVSAADLHAATSGCQNQRFVLCHLWYVVKTIYFSFSLLDLVINCLFTRFGSRIRAILVKFVHTVISYLFLSGRFEIEFSLPSITAYCGLRVDDSLKLTNIHYYNGWMDGWMDG